ncbi:MAG: Na/Pi symporter [Clostridiales bacterium]|nr:Na/Pi symporter [Clostridiales bacterium]
MILMLTELMSGLALFLFGMKFMSESLQKAAGDKMRGILNHVTKNKITAVFFGAIFTAVIQSSGATTVMEVSFVNAGLMSLEQSVGITFGANIGTTITSQLVSLKLTAVAPYIIFLGACMMMFGKKPIVRKISEIIFGFGALFLGINSMTSALSAIPDYPAIMHFFEYLEYYPVALLIGLLFTVIVQSSSVTVSVLVLLADSGLVGLGSCLYFILGANVGSCMPAMMAGMNSNRDGKRTALVHVLFNALGMIVISVILIFAMQPVTNLIASINGADNAKRFVANADTIFKTFP